MKESFSGGARTTSPSFSGPSISIGRGFESAGPRISAPTVSQAINSGPSFVRPSFGGVRSEMTAKSIFQMPRLEAVKIPSTDRMVPGKLAFTPNHNIQLSKTWVTQIARSEFSQYPGRKVVGSGFSHTIPVWSRPPEAVPKNIPGLEGFTPLIAKPPEVLDRRLAVNLKPVIRETVKIPNVKPEVIPPKFNFPEITKQPEINSNLSLPTPILSELNHEQEVTKLSSVIKPAVQRILNEHESGSLNEHVTVMKLDLKAEINPPVATITENKVVARAAESDLKVAEKVNESAKSLNPFTKSPEARPVEVMTKQVETLIDSYSGLQETHNQTPIQSGLTDLTLAKRVSKPQQEASIITLTAQKPAVSAYQTENPIRALAGFAWENPKPSPKAREIGMAETYPMGFASTYPVEMPKTDSLLQLQIQAEEETKRKLELIRIQLRLMQEKIKKKEEVKSVDENQPGMIFEKDDITEKIRREVAQEAVAKAFFHARQNGEKVVASSKVVDEMPEYDLQPKFIKSQLLKRQERRDGSYSRWIKDVNSIGVFNYDEENKARKLIEQRRRKYPAVRLSFIHDSERVDDEKVRIVYDSRKPELNKSTSIIKEIFSN